MAFNIVPDTYPERSSQKTTHGGFMKISRIIPALAAVCLLSVKMSSGSHSMPATLHPQPSAPLGSSVTVSFGMPFPKGYITDPGLIRVLDTSGNEIPAHVRTILLWRDIMSGDTLPYIRSALIQFEMTFGSRDPVGVIVKTGRQRKKDVSSGTPVRQNWVRVVGISAEDNASGWKLHVLWGITLPYWCWTRQPVPWIH